MVSGSATLLLFTTEHCHLCEQALGVLQDAAPGYNVHHRDIVDDDDLMSRYGTRIPVVRYREQELDWPFDRSTLRAFLDHCERTD